VLKVYYNSPPSKGVINWRAISSLLHSENHKSFSHIENTFMETHYTRIKTLFCKSILNFFFFFKKKKKGCVVQGREISTGNKKKGGKERENNTQITTTSR
jgi:hypothetical protein